MMIPALRSALCGVAVLTTGIFSLTATAVAAPVEWPVSEGGNGHFYEAVSVPNGISWFAAQAEAEARGGYLVSITSEEENTFVFDLIDSDEYWLAELGPWIGGFQPTGSAEPAGGFQWTNGDGLLSETFTNWALPEPNNSAGSENHVHFYTANTEQRSNQWNDYGGERPLYSYVIEYSLQTPENLTIASGDAVEGAPEGTVYRSFGIPSVGGDGFLAFRASVRGPEFAGNAILTGVTPEIVVKKGDAAPNVADTTFVAFSDPLVNPQNQIAFLGSLKGTGVSSVNNTGLWSDAFGSLQLVAREGDAPLGAGGDTIRTFVSVALSDNTDENAHIAFVASLTGSGVTAKNDLALFRSNGTTTEMVLRDGAELAIGGTPRIVKSFEALRPRRGARGQGDSINDGNIFVRVRFEDKTQAIVLFGPGEFEVIAENSSAESTFKTLGLLAGNGESAGVFVSSLTGSDFASPQNVGIFAENSENDFALELRVLRGTAASDDTGITFGSFLSPVLNNDGVLGFVGAVRGTGITSANNTGIWIQQGDAPATPIALEGEEPDGVPGAQWSSFTSLALTNGGGTENPPVLTALALPEDSATPIFVARMRRELGGITSKTDLGAWWVDALGNDNLIARHGGEVDVHGTPKTVRRMYFLGSVTKSPAQRRGFNDDGQIAYRLHFTDGQSAIVRQTLGTPVQTPALE